MPNFDFPLGIMAKELGSLRAILDSMERDYQGPKDEIALSLLKEDYRRLSKISLHFKKKEIVLFPYFDKYDVPLDKEKIHKKDAEIQFQVESLCKKAEKEDIFSLYPEFTRVKKIGQDMVIEEAVHFLPLLDEKLTEDDNAEIAKNFNAIGYFLLLTKPNYEQSSRHY